jgi:integrase
VARSHQRSLRRAEHCAVRPTEKIRPLIIKWRAKYADKPRTADYGMQVLSRVLAYCVDPLGKIPSNPCEGIKQVYSGSRAEIIWTDADIAHLKKTCSPEVAHAVDLAAHTGLRLGDLLRLCGRTSARTPLS